MQLRSLLAAASLVALAAVSPGQERLPLRDGWQLAPETEPARRPESGWQDVSVPSTFEDVLGPEFDGVCWYRIPLTKPAGADGARVRVRFHGAATHARVFADGVEVGSHLGAWTPWHVDVTEALAGGQALLEVRVDEKVGHNTQGFLPVIQPHFGGLWRSVELCVDRGPVMDAETVFTFGDAAGEEPAVLLEVPVLPGTAARRVVLHAALHDGARALASTDLAADVGILEPTVVTGRLTAPADVRRWSPDRPNLYRMVLELRDAETRQTFHRFERRVGFRDLRADGTTILWNDRPLQLRGMLHWGYSPPHFAPPEDPAFWRRQLEDVKSLGCNMLKACLWMPPRVVYDIADEIGLVVWQEYPTWHPTLTEQFLPELRQEYEEFHRYDRSHVSVAIRSLTCETGHSAELAVIRALYDRCKALVPQTLVVDDSAWIEWHRVHDFYDDHPYGNNSWWPGKIAQMREHIAAREAKPLLLGECIAADTWMDLRAWKAAGVADDVWWAPWGLEPQRAFAAMVERRFGAATRESLRPISLDYALRNRKYQVERLRLSFPDAGYTLSVIRDFTKARMGFFDDLDRLKWSPQQWEWHRDTLIGLDLRGSVDERRDSRALTPGACSIPVRVAHYGRNALAGRLTLAMPERGLATSIDLELPAGTVSDRCTLDVELPPVGAPERVRVEARMSGTHPATNAWDLWVHPAPTGSLDESVRIVEKLDPATIDHVKNGGRALLLAGDREGSLKTAGIWFLKGAPWAPPHALNDELPQDFLIELQSFDLEVGRVMHGEHLIEHVDPLLAFWDTHDIRHVNPWLLAFTTRLGDGRLGATVLNHDSPAGRYVLERLVHHLAHGEAPRSALPDELVARLEGALAAELLDLADWNIALDPADAGAGAGWMDGASHDGARWQPIRAGRHWEAQGIEHYDGVAWYRTRVAVPADWQGERITAVFEGVDDSYRLYVDGVEVGRYGDPATGESVWLVRTTADLTRYLTPGAEHTLVLRVVDHVGAGGIHKPVFLTTGPVDRESDLVH